MPKRPRGLLLAECIVLLRKNEESYGNLTEKSKPL